MNPIPLLLYSLKHTAHVKKFIYNKVKRAVEVNGWGGKVGYIKMHCEEWKMMRAEKKALACGLMFYSTNESRKWVCEHSWGLSPYIYVLNIQPIVMSLWIFRNWKPMVGNEQINLMWNDKDNNYYSAFAPFGFIWFAQNETWDKYWYK